jgi:hypothetical protein
MLNKLLFAAALVGLTCGAHAEPLKPEATASKATLGTPPEKTAALRDFGRADVRFGSMVLIKSAI